MSCLCGDGTFFWEPYKTKAIERNAMKLNAHTLDGVQLLSFAYHWWASIRETQRTCGDQRARRILAVLKTRGSLRDRGIDDDRWKLVTGATGRGDAIQLVLAFDERQGLILLVVPGTNEPGDWYVNLNARMDGLEGFPGRFREGFLQSALVLHDAAAVLARTAWGIDLYGGELDVVVIGHSLGGAIVGPYGALLTQHAHGSRPTWIKGLLTISAPRYCDVNAAQELTELYPSPIGQRVSVGIDLVPHAVLGVMRRKHALDGVHIGSDGCLRPRGRIIAELWNALKEPGFQPLSHHSIDKTILPAVSRLYATGGAAGPDEENKVLPAVPRNTDEAEAER